MEEGTPNWHLLPIIRCSALMDWVKSQLTMRHGNTALQTQQVWPPLHQQKTPGKHERMRVGVKGHTYLVAVRSYQRCVPSSELLWNNSCATWGPLSRFSFKSDDRTRFASYNHCSLGANVTVFCPCLPNLLLIPSLPISFLFLTLWLYIYLKSWTFCLFFSHQCHPMPTPLHLSFHLSSFSSHISSYYKRKKSILEKSARSWLAPESTTNIITAKQLAESSFWVGQGEVLTNSKHWRVATHF